MATAASADDDSEGSGLYTGGRRDFEACATGAAVGAGGDAGSLQCPSPPSLGLDGSAGDLPSSLGQGVRKPYKQCVSAGCGRYIVHLKHQHCCSICSTETHSAMKRNKVGNCSTPGCWRVFDPSVTASTSSCQAEPVGSASLPSAGGDNGNGTISAGSVSGGAAAAHRMTEATGDDRSTAKRSAFVDDRMDVVVALDLYAMD